MKVSVIIPVHNEFTTFQQVLERVRCAPLPAGCSEERTGIVVGHHAVRNAGKGMAIRTGIQLASDDIVLIQDGDLEYDPNDYAALLAPIVRGEADVVYGSRFLGRPTGMAWKNRIANRILTFAANLLYGAHITDEATVYKAFRACATGQYP
jgi:glycosyltransferase involved in cell wall biosynthesis